MKNRLKDLRAERGWSQQRLADELFALSIRRADAATSAGSRTQALAILRRARDESFKTENWINAQLRILGLSKKGKKFLAELDREGLLVPRGAGESS